MSAHRATLPDTQKQRVLLVAIIALFIAFCVFYNLATPLFEGLDEGAHYNYVNYLASHRTLPDLNSQYIKAIAQTHRLPDFEKDPNALGHETTQPPLYYAAGAVMISWIDRSDFTSVFKTADTMSHGMANIHTPAEQAFPPTGTVLAVRIVRLLSTLLGVMLIFLVYQIALRVTSRSDVAILAGCITAFNPKFIHISSVITNDIAVACAFTLALYIAIVLVTTTVHDTQRSALISFVLGLSIGLSALTKYSGLSAMMPSGIALIWYAIKFRRQSSFRRILLPGVLACGAGFALMTGWFFTHNWLQYADPLAWSQVQQANAFTYRVNPLSLSEMLSAVPMLFRTYWGVFGDGIQSPVEYDLPMWIIAGVGACGVLVAARRRRIPAEVMLLAVAAFATLIAFVSWMRMYAVTDNSRLLMPMTATVSILMSIGMLEWLKTRWRMPFVYVSAACAVLWALFVPAISLLPAYNPLTYLSSQQVTELPADGHVLFENGIEIYSAVIKTNRINAGEAADLTLFWRATRPITESYATVIEAFDDQNRSIGRLSTEGYLGRQFMTPEWEPGRVLNIHYRLSINQTRQTLARIFVGWYSPNSGKVIRVLEKGSVSAQVAMVKVRGATAPEQKSFTPFAAAFGETIQLEGYKVCGDALSLFWRSTGTPGRDYTVFVHALEPQGRLIGQSDAPVTYPTTYWDAGEQIIDVHSIAGLGNATSIGMGLYDSSTKERMTAKHPDGAGWSDNVVTIPIMQASSCP